jgi:tetratricopeptide (TPR) repeat protein
MPILSAEIQFKKGLAAFVDEQFAEAAAAFRQAIEIDRQRNVRSPEARYLSYYGLSLAKQFGPGPESIQACETAAAREPHNPNLALNLGRVYAMVGRTTRALECFEGGLRMAPSHRSLRRELTQTDRRARPVLPGLGRNHVVNRWLGGLRSRWLASNPGRPHKPAAAVSAR